MKRTYLYKGETTVEIPGLGVIKPGVEVITEQIINHPHFEEKVEKPKEEVKKDKKKKNL